MEANELAYLVVVEISLAFLNLYIKSVFEVEILQIKKLDFKLAKL
jgi:hypothetical protein